MSLSISTENFVLGGRRHNPDTLAREGQEGGQASEQERLEELKTVASLIEQLTQAGVSWQEIYRLVTQFSEGLGKDYNDAEPKESVVSRFRQAIGRVERAVSAKIERLTTSIASSLSRLVRSSKVRKVVISLLAAALSLQLTAPVLAADSKQNTLGPFVKEALVGSSGLGSQAGSVFSPFENQDANTPYGQSEAEKFDLEVSLEILDQYGYLDDLLRYVMADVESNNQEQIGFTGIRISGQNGESLINYSGIFSPGELSLNKYGNLEFVNNYGVSVAGAIGIVVVELPYTITIKVKEDNNKDNNNDDNPSQQRIQYLSGVTHWFGHCCGVVDDYNVFANLENLQPGDRVVITTANKLQYPFSVLSVGNVPKEYSTGMVYSDYKSALKFIAGVLLSTPQEPASKETLAQVEQILNESQNVSSAIESLQTLLNKNGINENLEKILRAFIDGRAMILMTCDSHAVSQNPNTLSLQSENRVVAIVELEPGQKPPEFLRPAVFVDSLNESVEEDKEFIKTMIRALYEKFPAIVKKWVQTIIKAISNPSDTKPTPILTPTATPVSTSTSGSNFDRESIRQDDTQPSPQPTLSPQPQPQPQLSEEERIQNRIANLQRLNAQVESVLPPIPLIPGSAEIDMNKIINDIMSGDKIAPLHELLVFFLSESKRLVVLQEYIQILEELTSTAQGENAQHLQNFLYQLKLVQLLVKNCLTIGVEGVGVGVVLILLAILKLRAKKK